MYWFFHLFVIHPFSLLSEYLFHRHLFHVAGLLRNHESFAFREFLITLCFFALSLNLLKHHRLLLICFLLVQEECTLFELFNFVKNAEVFLQQVNFLSELCAFYCLNRLVFHFSFDRFELLLKLEFSHFYHIHFSILYRRFGSCIQSILFVKVALNPTHHSVFLILILLMFCSFLQSLLHLNFLPGQLVQVPGITQWFADC